MRNLLLVTTGLAMHIVAKNGIESCARHWHILLALACSFVELSPSFYWATMELSSIIVVGFSFPGYSRGGEVWEREGRKGWLFQC